MFARLFIIEPTRHAGAPAVEWPTVLLAVGIYGGWLLLTSAWGHWPMGVVLPLLAVWVTWHGSLQHEVLHGHPTRWRRLNDFLGSVPLSIWIPYARYKRLHLKHHHNERLTDPVDDPESYYLTAARWASMSAPMKLLWRIDQTLLGRVTIGAPMHIIMYWAGEWRAVVHDEPGARVAWCKHLIGCVLVAYWVTSVCQMPFWIYLVAVVVPSKGLGSVRSFAEHRAHNTVHERIAIVEGSWFFGPLFLFNNLHVLHHDEPLMPWYAYNRRYRQRRSELLQLNNGLLYRTYFDVARRYLFKPHDVAVHPTGRVPRAQI
jgi:fatty acid desaturase